MDYLALRTLTILPEIGFITGCGAIQKKNL